MDYESKERVFFENWMTEHDYDYDNIPIEELMQAYADKVNHCKMNLYEIDFKPMYPVPSGLIVLAKNKKSALEIAETALTHTKPKKATLIEQDYEKVIFFESGDYQNN